MGYKKTKIMIGTMMLLICMVLVSCSDFTLSYDKSGSQLEETVIAQSTWIAHLSTRVAQEATVNFSQWDVIGYLATQMPYAMEMVTPTRWVTITPTPYEITEGEGDTTFASTPTPYIDIEYPPDQRTGIDEIDVVIDAIMGADIERKLELVRYTQSACSTADGLGGPPSCKNDEEEGTLVEAFPVYNGEGGHVRPDEITRVFDFTVRGLFAVYRVPDDAYETEYWPAGEYGIVFTSEDDGRPHVITIIVQDGSIIRIVFNMVWPPFDVIKGKSDNFILPPIR